MSNLLTKIIFLFIASQSFLSCQTIKVEKKTTIDTPQIRAPEKMKIEGMYDFFLAGDNLWLFFKDRLEVVKGPTEKEVIVFKRFESKEICRSPPKSKRVSIMSYFTDCIPRPSRVRKSGIDRFFSEIFERGYWVLQNEVAIKLGKQLYFFTFEGKFLRREIRKKGWQFEELPHSKYDWRYTESRFTFKDKPLQDGNPAVFSGQWALKIQGRHETKKFDLIDRSTGEYHRHFEARVSINEDSRIKYREYGKGFYIDQLRSPPEIKNNIPYPHRRPTWWFGKKVIELKNDDPRAHCYVFKEEEKCIPIPERFLRGILETETMLIFIWDKKLEIEFKDAK